MVYLGKRKKQDLVLFAEQLDIQVDENMKRTAIIKLITSKEDYDEEMVKETLNAILEERKHREDLCAEKEKELELKREEMKLEKQRLAAEIERARIATKKELEVDACASS